MTVKRSSWWTALIAAATAPSALVGADDSIAAQRGPDQVDVESTRRVRQYTTDPSFLTTWVDYVPESETVPSPRDFLGYVVGTPNRLTAPDRINEYFRELAETTDRVAVFSMGRSHGGREMIIAAIADADVLARLDGVKAANHALADPRRTARPEAARIAATTPVTYWLTAGLHSPETGPPEMVMELAYRLAVSEQPHIREIRGNVVTLISPVLEMDGRARMVDWYDRYLTEVTERQDSPPGMAPYWGDYTAHDNNRDGLQVSQPLTRNYTETYHEFLPTVSLDLHESVPLLYTSMGTGPYNDTIDPITVTEWQWLSSYDVSQATKLGLRGVWTWGFYTGWYPGYLLCLAAIQATDRSTVPINQRMITREDWQLQCNITTKEEFNGVLGSIGRAWAKVSADPNPFASHGRNLQRDDHVHGLAETKLISELIRLLVNPRND